MSTEANTDRIPPGKNFPRAKARMSTLGVNLNAQVADLQPVNQQLVPKTPGSSKSSKEQGQLISSTEHEPL